MAEEMRKAKPLPEREDIDTGRSGAPPQGELEVRRCSACTRFHWPPRLGCPYCGSGDLQWTGVAPTGRTFSWTVVHRSQTPGFEAEMPYAVVLVALTDAKSVRMVGNLVNCRADAIEAGMAVEAVFTPSADGCVKLVNWQPVG